MCRAIGLMGQGPGSKLCLGTPPCSTITGMNQWGGHCVCSQTGLSASSGLEATLGKSPLWLSSQETLGPLRAMLGPCMGVRPPPVVSQM